MTKRAEQITLRYEDIPDHVERLEGEGYTVLSGLLDPDLTESLREEVMTIVDETQPPFAQVLRLHAGGPGRAHISTAPWPPSR